MRRVPLRSSTSGTRLRWIWLPLSTSTASPASGTAQPNNRKAREGEDVFRLAQHQRPGRCREDFVEEHRPGGRHERPGRRGRRPGYGVEGRRFGDRIRLRNEIGLGRTEQRVAGFRDHRDHRTGRRGSRRAFPTEFRTHLADQRAANLARPIDPRAAGTCARARRRAVGSGSAGGRHRGRPDPRP